MGFFVEQFSSLNQFNRIALPRQLGTFGSHSKLRDTLVPCWFSFDRFCFAGSSQVPQAEATRYAVLFVLSAFSTLALAGLPLVHAPTTGTQYTLTPFPFISQEGYTITLILSVSGALPGTQYQFNFYVRDPSTKIWGSITESYTTSLGETQFGIILAYPSAAFVGLGTNSLVGQPAYVGWVNQLTPPPASNPVAVTPNGFYFILTDHTEYQRTQTVGIRASGYNASETATIIIRTQTSSTVVLNATTTASST